MKKTLLAVSAALAAMALPTASYADLAFNVGAVSDYRYRGISQTRLKPALQGGVDFTAGGFYMGAWGSTIKWIKDVPGGGSDVEIDLYGGYKGEIAKDLAFDVGLLQYWYPSATSASWNTVYKNPNTTEAYGALTFGPATAKLSYALTNLFGNYDYAAGKDSKGSYYLDISAGFDVGGGLMLTPHIGYQKVIDIANASYTDYSLTLSKDFSGVVPSIAIVGTDANKSFYVPGANANSTKFLGKAALVVGVKYNF
ncbi:TorF family putative porin [Aquabacterium sp. OR-4]|uniref:TorF family putative porin n=1 Tax=Aquabacterium sp. OR-4 TaxID=2978127 RepID=UPI0021B4244B|nr:TorF family putative porin [Aquabacterium sp. OR-4]MDT7837800.1 TorF family putative porin [Aquabacterium sp. OR-4]